MTNQENLTPTRKKTRLRHQLIGFALARLVLNTGHRMVYPFLPTIARGLGVDIQAVALAVTARSGLGLVSPAFGSLADRRGRRVAMVTGLLLFAGAMSLVTAWPTYPALFAALLIASAAKLIFDPAMQAYVGDRVHYARRGLAIAITELSWSGAFLLGMPLIAWLIARSGAWQAPFPMLAVTGLIAAISLWRLVPSDTPHDTARPSLAQGLHLVLSQPSALAGLVMGFFISGSNEMISIIYGAWLEDSFALKVTALGASATVIGIAELSGEGLVAGFVDRLGKRRAVMLGIGLNVGACFLLPLVGGRVEGALVALFVFYLTFEFAIVSSIPLMTELVPSARATLMAGNVTAFSAGRMVGALAGPWLFGFGLLANSVGAALFDVMALAALLLFVRQD